MPKNNTKNQRANTKERSKTKLSLFDKLKIKAIIKQAKKKLKKAKKEAKIELEERQKIYKTILLMGEAIPIEDEKGNKLKKEDMETMNSKELTELFEIILEDFKEQTT